MNAQGPKLILAPYFVANLASDPWVVASRALSAHAPIAATKLPVVPVIATENEAALPMLAAPYDSERLAVLVSDFADRDVAEARLVEYGLAIRKLGDDGHHFSLCMVAISRSA